MSGKAPYFPNNWKKFKDAPADMFTPHMFIEVMEWKVAGWELPSDVCCIIRATHLKTSKVKEHVYKRHHAAENKVMEYMLKQTHEFVVCTDESIHYVHPSKDYEPNDLES
jgi:HD-like signal output (HDOD) protein